MTPKFSDTHAPKHIGLQRLEQARAALTTIGPLATHTVPTPQRASSLLEFYLGNDVSRLLGDMMERPDHYSDRQKEIIEFLYGSGPIGQPVTEAEKDDLVLQLMRSTESSLKSRDLIRDLTAARHKARDAENEEIVMEDGTTLKDYLSGDSLQDFTFETQNSKDKIVF